MIQFSGKKVLVTGGTGMIGNALCELLAERGAQIRISSLDKNPVLLPGVEFLRLDLTKIEDCLQACADMNYVFHLAGIKGGVGIGRSQGALFLEGNALMNLHMLKAARESGVKRYLFTSTIGVYPDAEIFCENEVWDKPPHRSDWYGAWGKRLGELQCEAYLEQYGYESVIVRPANVYGPYDNFNPKTAMVIGSLIARATSGESPLTVWGDGTSVRDFIYSKDCAWGMLLAMEKAKPCDPLNLGSGVGISIRVLAETICKYVPGKPKIEWDASRPAGNKIRLMDISKARKEIGFEPKHSLEAGIRETIEWYLSHQENQSNRYSIFKD